MLALVLTLQSVQPSTPPWYGRAGRIIDHPFHLGIRPSLFVSRDEWDVAITVQVTR